MLEHVGKLIESEQYPEALTALDPYLKEHPEDPAALYLLGYVMLESDKPYIALHLYEKVVQKEPNRYQAWLNLGRCYDDLERYDEALCCFQKVLRLDAGNALALSNMSSIYIKLGDPETAEAWAHRAVHKDPNNWQTLLNIGFAKLARFDYEGWIYYAAGMGKVANRTLYNYFGEPMWRGEHCNVVIYGEQGIGDQIAFSNAIPDAARAAAVTLHTSPKLKGLFERSFGLPVVLEEDVTESMVDASCSLSELQTIYRDHVSKYDGKPYLKADPQRTTAYGSILRTGRPRIGISWTGGTKDNAKRLRSTKLETLLPILRAVDAHWVCLEYKDRSDEIDAMREKHGIVVHDYPWMTRTADYDDTAALLMNLDLVISVPQSVVHLAGGLGVDCWVLQNFRPHFFFGIDGETPLYGSVRQFRRKSADWTTQVLTVADELRRRYASQDEKAAAIHGNVLDIQRSQEGEKEVSAA